MQSEHYKIKLDGFEGPFDLLLDLIEKRKLHINDISLSRVADDYVAYVKGIEEFPLALSANFILVASTLLLIKSKSLLPALNLTEEEQVSIEELEERLRIYKRIKELSKNVKNIFGKEVIFPRSSNQVIVPVFTPDKLTNKTSVTEALRRVLASLPKFADIPKTVLEKVRTLEETIKMLSERITSSIKMSFRDFSAQTANGATANGKISKEDKVNVIVSFLAMLELVKQGIINVTQRAGFEDIEMETTSIGIPRY